MKEKEILFETSDMWIVQYCIVVFQGWIERISELRSINTTEADALPNNHTELKTIYTVAFVAAYSMDSSACLRRQGAPLRTYQNDISFRLSDDPSRALTLLLVRSIFNHEAI